MAAATVCAVPGCGTKRTKNRSRFCGAHLSRLRRTGDVRADVPVKHLWFGQYNRGRSKPVFDPLADDEL